MAVEGSNRSPDPPRRIGKYEIIAQIGEGAMGQVHKGRDTMLDRFVALKTMSSAMLGDATLRQRFVREAQSAARLNHPNIVTLLEFGEDGGQFFMAMELLDGEDLKDALKLGKLVTLGDKLGVMEQILEGVAYAHAMGVIHRDLKPANIHIGANGRIKVMDFGLARLGESEMTRAGTVMGTPNYMSPEQVRGERTGPTSDVFSLGAVCYEVLSRRRAFDADSLHAILYRVTDSEPVPLAQTVPDLPPIIEIFVKKALAKEPALRYQSASEMREALELCRRVVDGDLDEKEAIQTLRESATMIVPPDQDATFAAIEPAPQAAGTIPAKTRVPGRMTTLPAPGSVTAVRPAVRKGAKAASKPPVLSGAAPDAVVPPTQSGVSTPSSRTPVLIGVGVGALLIAGVVAAFLSRTKAPEPAPVDNQARAMVSVALEAQLEAARRSLEFKDLEGAMAGAEKALQLDPGNAEAQTLMRTARTSFDEVEGLARTAREAASKGDMDGASKALSQVLALMPKHPVAGELSAQLASRFKAKADVASKDMGRAAEAARQAGASSFRAYGDAAALSARAQSAYRGGQYTEAAQLFSEAQRGYEVSRRDAVALAAKPNPTVDSSTAVVAPTPRSEIPTSTIAPAPLPTLTQAPPEPVAAASAAPAPQSRPTPNEEAAVRQMLASLKRAIEEKDLALYKKIRPGLTADDERKLRDSFNSVASQQVDYSVDSVSFDGDRATLQVTLTGRVSGKANPPVHQVMRLVRSDSGWVIDQLTLAR
jgi:serine/threonine protein kinase